MALSHKLELRQSQSLVMTPQLMQAIKLLQLSNLDLIAYVDAELERNPLLERADGESDSDDGPASERDREDTGADAEVNGADDGEWMETRLEEPARISEKMDTDLSNVFQDDAGKAAEETPPGLPPETWQTTPSRQPVSSEDYNLEAFVAEEKSLADHLSDQLGLALEDAAMRLIGQTLVNEIDESGYLRADIAQVAERLGTTVTEVETTLAIIQTFEPAGVGARDLAECLAIQLRERDRYDPAMAALVAHLDLVAKRDVAALKRLCGVDDEDLAEMLKEIRALNPKPGASFGSAPVQPVIPDVIVRMGPDGGWLVELNSGTLPKVLVNQSYYATVARQKKTDTEKAYLAEALQTANWLVKSLDQRARTILKVATEIVRQQDAFLAEGVQHLRPLNLKTIAEAISMHESTVSRVTSNKYMATPRGIFELKYFFTASIAHAEGGEAHSAEAVRFRIRKLIDDEPASSILSDDTIVKILRESGVDIARRTVAKYREAMRIPSSVQRRREKLASL
ncbi:MAG TPA: RNA polymerase factor sigma-54 [Bauldia sp.]|nr:RNA polymerase factor sigma-54 [Bauldia sp.]